jgi:tRNA (Thr-GGU) A37 N-methylase
LLTSKKIKIKPISFVEKESSDENVRDKSLASRRCPPLGVFACRGPIRPNPIGLTLVELVKREENVLG